MKADDIQRIFAQLDADIARINALPIIIHTPTPQLRLIVGGCMTTPPKRGHLK